MYPENEGWPYHEADELAAADAVLRSGRVNYWTGAIGRTFEQRFAEHCGVAHGIAVANGSLALELALHALRLAPGDEVIVTPRSFVASASSVLLAGAVPVFADVDPDTQALDPEAVRARITDRTRAIIPVHLAGWPADMAALTALASSHGLAVIEDCAQAHGARIGNRAVGSFGDLAAYSFCQDKIMSTGGEGGLLLTNDETLAQRAWRYKDHGKDPDLMAAGPGPNYRYVHADVGSNWRLTELQAALGLRQLDKLESWVDRRRAIAAQLHAAVADLPALRTPQPPPGVRHAAYRFYTFVREEALAPGWDRARVLAMLREAGVVCGSGACPELYREGAFAAVPGIAATHCPVAEALGRTSIMVALHHRLSDGTVGRWAESLRAVALQASGGGAP